MWRVALGSLFMVVLSGCAGSVVGDAIRGPERLAADDDAYCQSIGARPGTDAYTSCRMHVTDARDARHGRALDRAAGAIQASQPSSSQTTCTSFGNTVNCNTVGR